MREPETIINYVTKKKYKKVEKIIVNCPMENKSSP